MTLNEICSKCGKDGMNCQCEQFHPNVTKHNSDVVIIGQGQASYGIEPSDFEIALGALADIAFSRNMTLDMARKKAKRIYEQLNKTKA